VHTFAYSFLFKGPYELCKSKECNYLGKILKSKKNKFDIASICFIEKQIFNFSSFVVDFKKVNLLSFNISKVNAAGLPSAE